MWYVMDVLLTCMQILLAGMKETSELAILALRYWVVSSLHQMLIILSQERGALG
jgi:hypothetical protein